MSRKIGHVTLYTENMTYLSQVYVDQRLGWWTYMYQITAYSWPAHSYELIYFFVFAKYAIPERRWLKMLKIISCLLPWRVTDIFSYNTFIAIISFSNVTR